MDHARLIAPGFWMLTVAPIVTFVRAALEVLGVTEPSWYWMGFALGGSLSGLGMILVGIGWWRTAQFRWLLAGAATAGIGHYILPSTPWAIVGPSLVHLGTGLVLSPRVRWALGFGGLAAAGAVLRHEATAGHGLLAIGAIGLLVAIVQAARSTQDMTHRT